MTSFWLIAMVMMIIAVGLTVWPLLGNFFKGSIDRRQLNISLLQEQYQQLDQDLAEGRIDDAIHASSKADLEAAILADTKLPDQAITQVSGKARFTAIALIAFIPLSSGLLYQYYGSPASLTAQPTAAPTQQDVENMVAGLAARLESEPDNLEGWLMLGKSYMMMRRYTEAKSVYQRQLKNHPDDVNFLLGYADALAMEANGLFTGKPYQTIQKILELEPAHIQGRWMAGMAEEQAGNTEQALAYWEPLLVDLQQISPDMAAELQRMITNINPVASNNSNNSSETSTNNKYLKINVSINPALASQINSSDVLFVYARAMQGPPMPLAIQKLDANNIPSEIILDDSTAMIPQMQLSNFNEVKIDARISATGSATPQSGDFYGRIENVEVTANPNKALSIIIDKIVE